MVSRRPVHSFSSQPLSCWSHIFSYLQNSVSLQSTKTCQQRSKRRFLGLWQFWQRDIATVQAEQEVQIGSGLPDAERTPLLSTGRVLFKYKLHVGKNWVCFSPALPYYYRVRGKTHYPIDLLQLQLYRRNLVWLTQYNPIWLNALLW